MNKYEFFLKEWAQDARIYWFQLDEYQSIGIRIYHDGTKDFVNEWNREAFIPKTVTMNDFEITEEMIVAPSVEYVSYIDFDGISAG